MRLPPTERVNGLNCALPDLMADAVNAAAEEWQRNGKVRRLWERDASLWTGRDEGRWLGWLGIAASELADVDRLTGFAESIRSAGFSHALLLGMGGSSLGPEVIAKTLGPVAGFPQLLVLDSTDPAQALAVEARVDMQRTLFIVSSKSGSTLEPNVFKQYFFDRVRTLVGEREAGRRFVAITDPGSKLQQVAETDGFRQIFLGRPDIGGRYSVLSDFGLVPAAVAGVDVRMLLTRTAEMVHACSPSRPVADNPGVLLGIVLGLAASRFGRDKVTLVSSPLMRGFGAWIEQLVAESTGKIGKGLLPVDGEELGAPQTYGRDRVFVYLRLHSAPDAWQDRQVDALERVGHLVVRIELADVYDVGQEFFRWEIATAVAGALLGVHPFDQPDVEASKIATRQLTTEYERAGALPAETPLLAAEGIEVFADTMNAAALAPAGASTLAAYLRAHLDRIGGDDYFALLAYVEMNDAHDRMLQAIRSAIRETTRVATCVEYGPRFLHSTGQLYKGGPNTGVFLQVTCDDAVDLSVPGQHYSFGIVKAAQARGDFQVLSERGRRALRVHLGADVSAGLATLQRAVAEALGTGQP